MTRAKDISKIVTDADLSGTLDVTGTVTAGDVTMTRETGGYLFNTGGSTRAGIRSDDQNNLTLRAGTDAIKMHVGADGNVGIGTSSPNTALQVEKDWVNDYGSINVSHSTNSLGGLGIRCNDVFKAGLIYKGGTTGALLDIGTYNLEPIAFRTNNSERMRIDSSGNVGINETNPQFKLDVEQVGGDAIRINAGSDFSGLQLSSNNGSWSLRTSIADMMAFYDVSSATERMRITSAGNVGIGTSSPNTKMTVSTGVNSSTRTFLVDNAHSGGSMYNAFGVYVGDTDRLVTLSADYGESIMAFQTNSSERMRIDSSGNVGIGTSSPNGNGLLTINAPTNNSPQIVFTENDTAKWLIGHRHDGDHFRFYDLANSAERMRIDSSGNVGIGLTAPTTRLHVFKNASGEQTVANFAAHNYGDAAATYIQIGTEYTDGSSRIGSINNGDGGGGNTSALVFETMNTTAGSFTERMRIRHDGRVNIPNAYTETTGNSANLFVDTDGRLIRATSSERYKNTITDATHGLNELLTLRPVTYKGNNDGDTVFGGLIAEEVHDAGLTEFVTYNDDGQPDALAYGNMVSLCIKAIQELKTELDEAKARIVALETA